MKSYFNILLFAAYFLVIAGFAWNNPAQPVYRLNDALVEISGSTSTDQWRMQSRSLESAAAFSLINNRLSVIQPLDFSIPVKSLVGSNAKRDKNIYRFLRSYPYDKIRFKYSYSDIQLLGKDQYLLKVTGNITIAGITQILLFDLQCHAPADSIMQMNGTSVLRMSRFHIVPERLPGFEKVNDEVMVTVKLKFKPE